MRHLSIDRVGLEAVPLDGELLDLSDQLARDIGSALDPVGHGNVRARGETRYPGLDVAAHLGARFLLDVVEQDLQGGPVGLLMFWQYADPEGTAETAAERHRDAGVGLDLAVISPGQGQARCVLLYQRVEAFEWTGHATAPS